MVGGAGAFGARLVAGLAAATDLAVIVAGRDLARAEAVARTVPEGRGWAARLDATRVEAAELRARCWHRGGCGRAVPGRRAGARPRGRARHRGDGPAAPPAAPALALRPTARASERVDGEGRFRFDVALFLPLVGLLVHDRGWQVRCDGREEETS